MNVYRSKWILLLLATVLIFLAAPSASKASDLNDSGNFFWDNPSWDGSGMNVGYCLTNSGTCTALGANAPGAKPFWQLSNGGADPNFSLSSTQTFTFTYAMGAGTNTAFDIFGWYNPANPAISGVLLLGTDAPGSTATLPAGTYGFYLTDSGPGVNETWFTQSSLNPSGETSNQHFVVFDPISNYWIGMEDLPFPVSDKDYQDMLVQVTTGSSLKVDGSQGGKWQPWSGVPEPGTVSLLVIGLVGIAFKRRKSVR